MENGVFTYVVYVGLSIHEYRYVVVLRTQRNQCSWGCCMATGGFHCHGGVKMVRIGTIGVSTRQQFASKSIILAF